MLRAQGTGQYKSPQLLASSILPVFQSPSPHLLIPYATRRTPHTARRMPQPKPLASPPPGSVMNLVRTALIR